MAEGDQVIQGTGTGEQGQGEGDVSQEPGWIAALTPEQQKDEWVKSYTKPPDFVKSALELKAENALLKGKVEKAIFKPGDNATAEETAAWRKGLGVPEKPEDYVIPVTEGIDNSPEMVKWAQGIFHTAGLLKGQAEIISQSWNNFVAGMIKAEEETAQKDRLAAEEGLKKELGTEEKYKEGTELVSRLLKECATPEELQWLQESKMGNHPALLRLVLKLAKKTGEDSSPVGSGGGGEPKAGFIYDKSPAPPKG